MLSQGGLGKIQTPKFDSKEEITVKPLCLLIFYFF